MKRIFVLLAFVLMAAATQAQDQGITPEKRAEAMTMAMMKHLRLSGAQMNKVREINLSSIKMMEEAKKELKTNPQQFKATADRISSSRLAALKEVLTPAQFEMYNQHREKKMGVSTDSGPGGLNKKAMMEEYSN